MNIIDNLEYKTFSSFLDQPSAWQQLCSIFKKKEPGPFGRPILKSDPATYSPCNPMEKLKEYQYILGFASCIYVFRNGTCVFSNENLSEEEAKNIMFEYGFLETGTETGDFYIAIITAPISGFVVKYSSPNIISFANENEFSLDVPFAVVGSALRLGRHMDSYDLQIVSSHKSIL